VDLACKTLENVQGAWLLVRKVVVDDDKIQEYRVVLNVTFVLEG